MKKKILVLLFIGLLAVSLTFFAACGTVSRRSHKNSADSGTTSEHEHDYDTIVVPPTCEGMGLTTYVCKTCGFAYAGDYVDATGHDWNDGEVTTPATFETLGEKTYTCTVCGKTKTEELPQLLHTYSEEWSSDGESHWHACTDEGYGDLKESVAAHDWNDGEVTIAATCEAAGEMTYTCTICGKTKTEPIAQLVHDYEFDSFVWDGFTARAKYVCTNDASHLTYFNVNVTESVTIPPTCTETGIRAYTASFGGYTDVKTEVIAATGHDLIGHEAKAATCTEAGWNAYETCTRCDYSTYEEIAAIGHTYVSDKCTKCGTLYNAGGKRYVRIDANGNESATSGYILFGEYPQTVKADSVTITSTTDSRGYYLGSDGAYYAKVTANPYESGYKFTTGATVTKGTAYYFKVEPIKWRILEDDDGTATILCEMIIDAHRFDDSSNNYKESEIRAWLNNNFYNKAFSELERGIINTVQVDNSAKSTMPYGVTWNGGVNNYACANTYDKVWLLSEEEMTRSWEYVNYASYNIDDSQRNKQTTDYAKANYAYTYNTASSTYYDNGWWWLRSPSSSYSDNSRYLTFDYGYANYIGNVSDSNRGVVPALKISLEPEQPEEEKVVVAYNLIGALGGGDEDWETVAEDYAMTILEEDEYSIAVLLEVELKAGDKFKAIGLTEEGEFVWNWGVAASEDVNTVDEHSNAVMVADGKYDLYLSKDGNLYIVKHEEEQQQEEEPSTYTGDAEKMYLIGIIDGEEDWTNVSEDYAMTILEEDELNIAVLLNVTLKKDDLVLLVSGDGKTWIAFEANVEVFEYDDYGSAVILADGAYDIYLNAEGKAYIAKHEEEPEDPTVRPALTTSNPRYSTSGENVSKEIANDVLTLKGAYYMRRAAVDNGSDFMVQMTFTAVSGAEYIFLLSDDLDNGRGRITFKNNKFNMYNYTSGTYKGVEWHWYDAIEARSNTAEALEDGKEYTLTLVHKNGKYVVFINGAQAVAFAETEELVSYGSKSDPVKHVTDIIGGGEKVYLGIGSVGKATTVTYWGYSTDADRINEFMPDEVIDPTVRPALTTSNPKYSTSGENKNKTIENDVLTLQGAYYMDGAVVDNGSDFMVQMTFTAVGGTEYIFLLTDDLESGRGRITLKKDSGVYKFNFFNYTSGTYKDVAWNWYDSIERRTNNADDIEDGNVYTLTLVHKNGKYVVFINGVKAVEFAENEKLQGSSTMTVADLVGDGEKVYLGIGILKETTVSYWGYSTDAEKIAEFIPDEQQGGEQGGEGQEDPTVRPELTTSNPKYSTSGENKNKTIENDVLTLEGAYYMDGAVVDNGSDFMVQMKFTAVSGAEYVFLMTDDLESGRGRITFRSDNKFCMYNYTSGTYKGVAWNWYDGIEERANAAETLKDGKEYTLTLVHKNGKYVVFINGVKAVAFAETEELTMWGSKSDPVKHVTDIVGDGEKVYLGIGSIKKETTVTYWGYSTDAEKIAAFIPDEAQGGEQGGEGQEDPTVRPALTTSNPKYSGSGENKNKTIDNDVLSLEGAYYMDGAAIDNGSDFMVQMTFTAVSGAEYVFLMTDDLESGRGRITFRNDNKFCIYNYTSGTYNGVKWDWYDCIEERANSACALDAGKKYTLTLVHKNGKYVVFINGVKAVEFAETEELTMWGGKSDPVKHVTDIVGGGEKVYLGIGSIKKETTVTYWGYSTDAEKIAAFLPDEQ